MKKFAFLLSMLMVIGVGVAVYAMNSVTSGNNKTNSTLVTNDDKPHQANCTCSECAAKKAETKTATTNSKDCPANCSGEKCKSKADCKSGEAKKCCKKAMSTDKNSTEQQKTDSK